MSSDAGYRTLTPDDAPALYDAIVETLDDLKRVCTWPHLPLSVESQRTWLEQCAEKQARGERIEYGLFEGDRLLLTTAFTATGPQEAEVGYWTRRSAQRQGLTKTAVSTLCTAIFDGTPIIHLHAQCNTNNVASRRILESCGFTYTGDKPVDLPAPEIIAGGYDPCPTRALYALEQE